MNYPTAIYHSQALELIYSELSAHQLKPEVVLLAEAKGRTLQEAVLSPNPVPEYDCSRMDGYAINLGQVNKNPSNKNSFRSLMGDPIHAKAQNKLIYCDNKAVPVMTGALLPVDCDAIIIKENVLISGDYIEFEQLPTKGQYIREAGSDLSRGQVVVKANQALSAAHLGLLSSLGFVDVVVKKKPLVALFLTGDEIIQPGKPCALGQFYDANTLMLKQLLLDAGCEVKLFPTLKDDVKQVTQFLASPEVNDCDVIITVGGVSMGDRDWIPHVVNQSGKIIFHKVLVRPGFPMLFGKLNESLFFGLPGNPVSAYTTMCQYILFAVRSLLSQTEQQKSWTAEISVDWKKTHERREFLRGYFDMGESGRLQVNVCGQQQSSRIESLSEANCFVVLDETRQDLKAGDQVFIQPFSQFKTT